MHFRKKSNVQKILVLFIDLLINLAYFGGHARHILSPLSPSQPVIADGNIICWGTFVNLFTLFSPQAQHSTAQSTRTSSKARTRRPERGNASMQTELAGASMPPSIFTARCVLKTCSKSAGPTKICNNSQHSLRVAGVMLSCELSKPPA